MPRVMSSSIFFSQYKDQPTPNRRTTCDASRRRSRCLAFCLKSGLIYHFFMCFVVWCWLTERGLRYVKHHQEVAKASSTPWLLLRHPAARTCQSNAWAGGFDAFALAVSRCRASNGPVLAFARLRDSVQVRGMANRRIYGRTSPSRFGVGTKPAALTYCGSAS